MNNTTNKLKIFVYIVIFIHILIYLFIGPLVSLSLKRFSTRQVTMAGALVCALGLISSAFAPSVSVLIVMYGLVAGASRGFFSLIFGFCRMYWTVSDCGNGLCCVQICPTWCCDKCSSACVRVEVVTGIRGYVMSQVQVFIACTVIISCNGRYRQKYGGVRDTSDFAVQRW